GGPRRLRRWWNAVALSWKSSPVRWFKPMSGPDPLDLTSRGYEWMQTRCRSSIVVSGQWPVVSRCRGRKGPGAIGPWPAERGPPLGRLFSDHGPPATDHSPAQRAPHGPLINRTGNDEGAPVYAYPSPGA